MEGFQLIQLLCPISDFVEGPICGSIEISSSPSAGKEEMNPEMIPRLTLSGRLCRCIFSVECANFQKALSSFALHQGNPKYYEEGQAMVNPGKLSSPEKSEACNFLFVQTKHVCKHCIRLHQIASLVVKL